MKLVAQMDEISSINIETDSTFAMLLEAQNRGHEIFYYLPSDLSFNASLQKVTSLVRKIRLKKDKKNYYQIDYIEECDLTIFDVILVRQDPPFDLNYITSTYLLEKIKDRVLILNNPSEIRNCPEKIFVTEFSNLTPPTLITSEISKIKEFRNEHQRIIMKPLYACGGEGVVFFEQDDPNIESIFELMIRSYKTPLIVQKFLPEITSGDHRIILLDGEFVGGVTRVAKKGEIRSNLHVGGVAKKMMLSSRQKEICEKIGPELKKRGLFFVGIDVIGDYITEINVTSPTCIPEINRLNDTKIERLVIEAIEAKLSSFQ